MLKIAAIDFCSSILAFSCQDTAATINTRANHKQDTNAPYQIIPSVSCGHMVSKNAYMPNIKAWSLLPMGQVKFLMPLMV
ncbi:MAG: hypothetical protein J6568_08255 [Snodgrassella sp.]|nr:hypothetical protein [Snodgrassella sp.]